MAGHATSVRRILSLGGHSLETNQRPGWFAWQAPVDRLLGLRTGPLLVDSTVMTASISSLTATADLLGWSTASTATGPAAVSMPSWGDVRGGVLSAVSSKLGITQADLTAQLKTGKSMADIATAAGVSTSDLTATIQTSLEASGLPAGINFATMATRMANNKNNASIEDGPATAPTTTAPASTTTSSSSGLGIDTSAVDSVTVGGLSLSSDEVSMLLGTSTGSTLDAYL